MAALRSSRCLNGDSGAGFGMSLALMNRRKPIIQAPSSAPNIRLDSKVGSVQSCGVFFDGVAVAGERRVVVKRWPAGGHGLQSMIDADTAENEQDHDSAEAQHDIGDNP